MFDREQTLQIARNLISISIQKILNLMNFFWSFLIFPESRLKKSKAKDLIATIQKSFTFYIEKSRHKVYLLNQTFMIPDVKILSLENLLIERGNLLILLQSAKEVQCTLDKKDFLKNFWVTSATAIEKCVVRNPGKRKTKKALENVILYLLKIFGSCLDISIWITSFLSPKMPKLLNLFKHMVLP